MLTAAGLPIGTEIPQARLQNAIDAAELYIVKRAVGDSAYIQMQSIAATDPKFIGGLVTVGGSQMYIAGLKRALCHIAFAMLLQQNANATTFGVVKKSDEHSVAEDPFSIAKHNYSIGIDYLRDVCVAMGFKFRNTNHQLTNTL